MNRQLSRGQPMVEVPVIQQNSPAYYVMDPAISPLELGPTVADNSGDSGRGGSSEEGTHPSSK
ncbi:hypothetical protein Ciccas_012041 [Cichlidogyrus casuarinus]|uniref:Uncharacterized protein n=1 Tax=Cichlidogyrus casuarinus TaxID=1844966 RepID=A0ABD2PPH8_9PLAT